MAKVIISGDSAPTIVSEELGRQIREKRNDPRYRGMIDVNGRSITKSKIREVILGDGAKPAAAYDPANPDDMARLDLFEAEMERVYAEAPPRPLSWYGEPHDEFAARHPDIPPRFGWVFNPMLGLVPWHYVEFAIQQHAIVKTGASWCVVANLIGETKRMDLSSYQNVMSALKAIRERQARKEYAARSATGGAKPFRYTTPDIGAIPNQKVEATSPTAEPNPFDDDEFPILPLAVDEPDSANDIPF